ncbi:MAG: T9SS type A sorting domain-containing protein [Bacteroidales bacterium]
MKKLFTIFSVCLFLLAGTAMQGQVLLAKWTFPTGNPTDSLADGGLPVNLDKAIHTEGGTSAIDFTKNGATTKAAQATGWDNGANTKCWVVSLSTLGYEKVKLSSKQQTGGNNPGPRDYKVQYRVGATDNWEDVPNSTIITANDWTTGVLDTLELPMECQSIGSLYLRWIMTTNTNSSGGTVASSGIDKIDDIYITGDLFIGMNDHQAPVTFSVSPNPANGPLTITCPEMIRSLDMIDLSGKIIYSDQSVNKLSLTIKGGFAPKGSYIVRIHTNSGATGIKPVIVL